MAIYEVTMQHSEESFLLLARMQHELFNRKNQRTRMVLSLGLVLLGMVYAESGWGMLLVALGCFLATGKNNRPNRTAKELTEQIQAQGGNYPASRYEFHEDAMEIVLLPEIEDEENSFLSYDAVYRLAEDAKYFYLFRDAYGGYMVPKDQLKEQENQFRKFLQEKTGQHMQSKIPAVRFVQWLKERKK